MKCLRRFHEARKLAQAHSQEQRKGRGSTLGSSSAATLTTASMSVIGPKIDPRWVCLTCVPLKERSTLWRDKHESGAKPSGESKAESLSASVKASGTRKGTFLTGNKATSTDAVQRPHSTTVPTPVKPPPSIPTFVPPPQTPPFPSHTPSPPSTASRSDPERRDFDAGWVATPRGEKRELEGAHGSPVKRRRVDDQRGNSSRLEGGKTDLGGTSLGMASTSDAGAVARNTTTLPARPISNTSSTTRRVSAKYRLDSDQTDRRIVPRVSALQRKVQRRRWDLSDHSSGAEEESSELSDDEDGMRGRDQPGLTPSPHQASFRARANSIPAGGGSALPDDRSMSRHAEYTPICGGTTDQPGSQQMPIAIDDDDQDSDGNEVAAVSLEHDSGPETSAEPVLALIPPKTPGSSPVPCIKPGPGEKDDMVVQSPTAGDSPTPAAAGSMAEQPAQTKAMLTSASTRWHPLVPHLFLPSEDTLPASPVNGTMNADHKEQELDHLVKRARLLDLAAAQEARKQLLLGLWDGTVNDVDYVPLWRMRLDANAEAMRRDKRSFGRGRKGKAVRRTDETDIGQETIFVDLRV